MSIKCLAMVSDEMPAMGRDTVPDGSRYRAGRSKRPCLDVVYLICIKLTSTYWLPERDCDAQTQGWIQEFKKIRGALLLTILPCLGGPECYLLFTTHRK